jgi:hypothetical protein
MTTIIQDVESDSVAGRDGRLQAGDHILKLNGYDLTLNSHDEVVDLFAQAIPLVVLTIYRDSLDKSSQYSYEYREGSCFLPIFLFSFKFEFNFNFDSFLEILKINLDKQKGQILGIKLGHHK